ncbi:hypothetical protein AWB69_08923 [Caballeronia udeis]|uniref:Uncharacterized protein n=1 Tax=Caballeronia udeis TaxID=1232866 RepID=A0A158JX91_9BURK|nr:hypothetical protein AWB69_08923 [Caballeronia udeis]
MLREMCAATYRVREAVHNNGIGHLARKLTRGRQSSPCVFTNALPVAQPTAGAASPVRMASIGAAVRRLSLSQDTRADSRRTLVCRRKTCAPQTDLAPRRSACNHEQWPDGPFACDFVLVTEDLKSHNSVSHPPKAIVLDDEQAFSFAGSFLVSGSMRSRYVAREPIISQTKNGSEPLLTGSRTRNRVRKGGIVEDRQRVDVFPCALVFIDVNALGSPNYKSNDPLSYVRQAICLHKSLLHAGFARLNIFTNAVDTVFLSYRIHRRRNALLFTSSTQQWRCRSRRVFMRRTSSLI